MSKKVLRPAMTLRLSEDMLPYLDQEVARLGMSRTAYIQMLIAQEMANDDRQRALTAEHLLRDHGILEG